MEHPLRLLLIEDSENDALLILRELQRGGYRVTHQRVDTPDCMATALKRQPWDVIIADYRMPHFSAPAALELLQQHKLDLPFIIVSGTIGEDRAVAAMKAGAHDYLMKENLVRLVPAVERELREARERQQRRQAEQALRESEERFRSLIENAQDIITLLTADGTIAYASPAVERVLGYSPESLLGRSLFKLVHDHDRPLLVMTLAGVLNQPGTALTVECRVQDCYGNWRMLEAIGKQFFDPQRQTSIVVNARDITDRKQAEEIQQQLEKERQLRELKATFFSMMSHELKNPLGSILAAAELLEHYSHQSGTEKKHQFFQVIRSGIRQITDLLNDTLVIGQAESGRLEFRPAPLDLEALCHDLVTQLQFSSSHQGNIHFHCGASLPPTEIPLVEMDQDLLRHILSNLLSNALKYSPPEEAVYFDVFMNFGNEVEAQQESQPSQEKEVFGSLALYQTSLPLPHVIFRIQDQGIGIPREDQQRLFDTFHRARNVGRIPGTGLGLAIVKQCVDLHGGQIIVHSEIAAGTTFTVILPFRCNPPIN